MKRTSVALSLAALMIFGAVGCGDDEKADDTTELQSDGDKASDTTEADSNDSSDETTDETIDDSEVPDLGDLDMGDLGDCMAVGVTYAGLALSALGGEDAAKEAIGEIEELKAELPEELEDDLAVVADAYGELAEKGMIDGSEALDSDEFKEADANIQAWIEETCGS